MADNPQFNAVLGEMADLHDRKNHDYAEDNNPYSNFEYAAAHAGVTVQQVFDVMLGIKQARLRQLTVKDAINESIRDSMIDRAVYAALAVAYYDAQAAQGTPPQPSLFAGTLEKVTALATRATLNPNRNLYCVPAPPDHIEGAEFRSEGD